MLLVWNLCQVNAFEQPMQMISIPYAKELAGCQPLRAQLVLHCPLPEPAGGGRMAIWGW